jgi:Protein of unknown function (DUF3089)
MLKHILLAILFLVFRGASFCQSGSNNTITNYSLLSNWAAHPYKKDCSDSVPLFLKKGYVIDSTVDVFFIHPTSYTDAAKPFGNNAVTNNLELNNQTDLKSILYQASIFNASGRVFAPRYKQAHISNYFPNNLQDSLKAIEAFDIAYADVKAAFEYFLKNNNNQRPIIIASHSQGTTHAKRLLKEFFDGKPLQNRLVVAYLVGMAIENNYFKNIVPCNNPNQTGCVCSWRTFKEGYVPQYIQQEKNKAIVTNPITWTETLPVALPELNKGTILKNFNKLSKKVVGATVFGNVLWTQKPNFFGSILLTTKNYHIADFNFFYVNIRDNAKQRINLFWKH